MATIRGHPFLFKQGRHMRFTFFALFVVAVFSGCVQQDDERTGSQPPIDYQQGDVLQVSGTLVDSRCYGMDKSHISNDHDLPEGHIVACGTACARRGFPVAVVEGGAEDGAVWMLLANAQALADYVSATVRVEGTFRDTGILIPTRIELKTRDGWTIVM